MHVATPPRSSLSRRRPPGMSRVIVALAMAMSPWLPASAAEPVAKPARTGQAIYGANCSSCHVYGMSGAPKIGDKAAWAPRLAQGDATLYDHVLKGKGWMPARGTCYACSDAEVKAAVDFLLSKVR